MELVLVWFGLSVVTGMIAQGKNRCGVCWFFVSVFTLPLLALLLVGLASELPPDEYT